MIDQDETDTDVTGFDHGEDAVQADTDATVAETGEAPRDERHDSIDPATGTLTAEAVDLRAERGIDRAGLQSSGDE